ncbi:isochorismatase family protein [Rhodococcus sp. NPDC003382]|uniref:isochorismatase family protein n=1 Tax=unclassified Rhodococcus (in: high G+C Gram-positive bacteria) TaxID=192944 RepID=UPI0018CCAD7D|nr:MULTISPECIES: isochorismatase family protein [unclassified Rhodococcus (in: high G+C Gram-positive bacteria)]MBH0121020.1 isochorismatase family protein [Rhodococcus sp. CX]MCK8674267.1 isochorismatase family protein [Rhodococcus sp. HM1]
MTIADRAAQAEDYARAGFGQELEPGARPALIVVDPARAYIDPDCPLYAGVEENVEAMRTLLAEAREAGIPVVITEVRLRADGSDAGVFFKKSGTLVAFCEGSPYGEFIDGLEPTCAEMLVTKKYPSAFFGTTLNSHLTWLGVDTVLIAGLSTSGCVRATTLDAMQHGFIPIVVEDAVGDRDSAIHRSNLFDMQQKMAEVWPLSRAQEYLRALSSGN